MTHNHSCTHVEFKVRVHLIVLAHFLAIHPYWWCSQQHNNQGQLSVTLSGKLHFRLPNHKDYYALVPVEHQYQCTSPKLLVASNACWYDWSRVTPICLQLIVYLVYIILTSVKSLSVEISPSCNNSPFLKNCQTYHQYVHQPTARLPRTLYYRAAEITSQRWVHSSNHPLLILKTALLKQE